MNILSLIKSTVERYLGWSQVLAVMNIAAMSILECGFCCTYVHISVR